MDDDFLLSQTQTTPYMPGQQGQGPQAPQPPAPPPMPFTQADSLQIQRLQQGLSTAQQQEYEGIISEEDSQKFKGMIQQRLAPLMQRQQQTQQAAEQKGIHQAMQQSALQESIAHTHAVKQAQGFPDTVATYTDPVTGRTEHFYQDARGKFKPLEFTVATSEEERQSQAFENKPDSGSTAPPMTASAPQPQGNQPMTMDEFGAQMRGSAQNEHSTPQAAPQILNQYGEQGPSGRGERDEWGRPTGTPGTDAFSEMFRRAEAAIPKLRPGASPHEILHRQELVGQLANRQLDRLSAAQDHRERSEAATVENKRREAEVATRHKNELELKAQENRMKQEERKELLHQKQDKEKTLPPKDQLAHVHQIETQLAKEQHDWKNNIQNVDDKGKPLPLPDHLKPENEEATITSKFQRSMKILGANNPNKPAAPDNKDEPPTGGLDPEVAKQPNPIANPQRIMDIKPAIDNGLAAIPQKELDAKDSQYKPLHTELKAMAKLIDTAHKEGRGLLRGEVEVYEQHHKQLEAILQSHQVHDAPLVRATSLKPLAAKPAAQAARPVGSLVAPNDGPQQ